MWPKPKPQLSSQYRPIMLRINAIFKRNTMSVSLVEDDSKHTNVDLGKQTLMSNERTSDECESNLHRSDNAILQYPPFHELKEIKAILNMK
jgi:hypothetical protein